MAEDVKNLQAEVDLFKNTVKSLSSIIQEGEVVKKSINNLKEEIHKIKEQNIKLTMKVKTNGGRFEVWYFKKIRD